MFSLTISLLLLGLAGVGYLACPATILKLRTESPAGFFALWQTSLDSFAIPISLFLLVFSRGKLIRLACLAWGLWMALSTLIVLWGIRDYAPEATSFGTLFLVFILIFSSAISIFSAMTFYHPPPPPVEPKKDPLTDGEQIVSAKVTPDGPTPE